MPGAHAMLSASGAYRWLACPPSAKLEADLPEQSSVYAEEGTRAHDYAEKRINAYLKHNKKPEAESPEMEEAVGRYVDTVLEKYARARKITPDAVLLVEQRLDFSPWVPDGFGTGDALIIADGTIEVIDLKYGRGVPVYAEGNPQMRLYALGAVNTYGVLYDLDKVTTTIVQPRLDHIDEVTMTTRDLLEWAATVKDRAAVAYEGGGEFASGPWCRFCKINPTCRKRAEDNLALARYEFASPATLRPDEVADVLKVAGELQQWAGDIKDWALDQAVNKGVEFEGWKVVSGRSARVLPEENIPAAEATLLLEGYDEASLWRRSFETITALEKLTGKKLFGELLGAFIVRSQGKPALVPVTDNRPGTQGMAGARADFDDEGNK